MPIGGVGAAPGPPTRAAGARRPRRAAAPPRRPARRRRAEPPPRPLRRCFPERPAWVDAPVADAARSRRRAVRRRRLRRRARLRRGGGPPGAALGRGAPQPRRRAAAPRSAGRGARRAGAGAGAGARRSGDAGGGRRPQHQPAAAVGRSLGAGPRVRAPRQPARARAATRERRRAPRAARGAGAHRSRALGSRRCGGSTPRWRRRPSWSPPQYERGVALFELCRFDDARRMFEKVLAATPDHAPRALPPRPHRGARSATTPRRRATWPRRRARDAEVVPGAAGRSRRPTSRRACGAPWPSCPTDVRRDLGGHQGRGRRAAGDGRPGRREAAAVADHPGPVPRPAARLQRARRAADAGRARGQGAARRRARSPRQAATVATATGRRRRRRSATRADRAIVLYRRNLLRTVHDDAELDQAIARTLLHEVGHLRGEDDGSLRDRGLE